MRRRTPVSTEDKQEQLRRPVGIWIRVSTEDQAKGESPEHHEKRGRMYAESRGWSVIRVYDLSAVSGKSVMAHPECQAMLADVREGRIAGLIFSKLARLARNTKELLEFAEYFEEHSADLVSLQESIDTSTPAGRLFYTMIAALAQWEREEIADRVKASVQVRAELGKCLGGGGAYGYRWQDRQLVLEPTEAPVRALMFELFLKHQRMKTVAAELNKAGHRTRSASPWSDTTVKRLLTDPIAKGLRRANYVQNRGRREGWDFKPEEEWIWTEAPAIVSEELWGQVNAIIDEQARGRKPYRRAVYLFSGVTFCGCGAKMYRPAQRATYYCRTCRRKIPESDLGTVFVEQLKGFFFNPEEIARQMEAADRELEDRRALLRALERERAEVKRRKDKAFDLYVAGELATPQDFGQMHRPLEERLAQLDAEIPRLQGQIDFLTIRHASTAEIVAEARTLYSSWANMTAEDRRTVVETIVERITIGDDWIDIDLAHLPPLPPPAEQAKGVTARLAARSPAPAPQTGATGQQSNCAPGSFGDGARCRAGTR